MYDLKLARLDVALVTLKTYSRKMYSFIFIWLQGEKTYRELEIVMK